MCAWDGVEPAKALAISRGGYCPLADTLSNERKQRKELKAGSGTKSSTLTSTSTRTSIDSNNNTSHTKHKTIKEYYNFEEYQTII